MPDARALTITLSAELTQLVKEKVASGTYRVLKRSHPRRASRATGAGSCSRRMAADRRRCSLRGLSSRSQPWQASHRNVCAATQVAWIASPSARNDGALPSLRGA